MDTRTQYRKTVTILEQETDLQTWVEAFLLDRKAAGLADGTLKFYKNHLKVFCDFCDSQVITQITQITPNLLRQFILTLEDRGRNPGGLHAAYRAVRAFLYFFELEYEPENWRNPVKRVKAPRVPTEPLDPVELVTVEKMVKACNAKTFHGARDKALILALLDTGARASEMRAIDLDYINLVTGAILIKRGKGRKPRTVFIGKKTRRAVRAYLRMREDDSTALWVTQQGERIGQDVIWQMLERRAQDAGVVRPSPHKFRRAFALNMLRNGTDIYTLSKLMGHEGLSVLQRYLKQTTDDTELAHRRASPVDNADW